MKVYHGSLEIIKHPTIRESLRTLDFGAGFYTTSSFLQAEQWVRRKLHDETRNGYISVYELSESSFSHLHILKFKGPTREWVDFVMKNRTDKNFNHQYDLVYGPVANDRVYAAFALYEEGLLDKGALIKELKTYTLVDQLLFHSDEALNFLSFTEAIEIIR